MGDAQESKKASKPEAKGDTFINSNKIEKVETLIQNFHAEKSEEPEEDRRKKQDDSAEKTQGRQRIGKRKKDKRVHPKYMTPKEYTNYKAELWDGIETRDNHYNYTPWDWNAGRLMEQRSGQDRRQSDEHYDGEERRNPRLGRRMSDKESERIHTFFLISLGGILFLLFTASLYGRLVLGIN